MRCALQCVTSDDKKECVAVGCKVCCSVLQWVVRCVAVCFVSHKMTRKSVVQCVAVRCSVLQCVVVCVAVCLVLHQMTKKRVLQCAAACCSVVQCVAVCCSVLQCVLQYVLYYTR